MANKNKKMAHLKWYKHITLDDFYNFFLCDDKHISLELFKMGIDKINWKSENDFWKFESYKRKILTMRKNLLKYAITKSKHKNRILKDIYGSFYMFGTLSTFKFVLPYMNKFIYLSQSNLQIEENCSDKKKHFQLYLQNYILTELNKHLYQDLSNIVISYLFF